MSLRSFSSIFAPTQISKRWLLLWFVLIGMVIGRQTEPAFLLLAIMITTFQSKKLYISRRWIVLGGCLFVHSLVMNFISGYGLGKFFQQVILLCIVYIGYNQILNYCRFSWKDWFLKYIHLVYVLSCLGLLQFAVMISTGFDIFPYTFDGEATQNTIRLHAMLAEPGSFAAMATPAMAYVFLAKDYWVAHKWKGSVIILAYMLTLTTSAFVALLIVLFLKACMWVRWLKPILAVTVICIFSWSAANVDVLMEENSRLPKQLQGIQLKIAQTLTVFENATPEDFELLNASSYATLTNYWIAFNAPHRLLGTGLGSHEQNYERLYQSNYYLYGLNKDDGYSMFARLFSEFGWLGIILYAIYLYKCYNRDEIISLCLLVFFISYLIKGGHYTMYGVAFFHILYYRARGRNLIQSISNNK